MSDILLDRLWVALSAGSTAAELAAATEGEEAHVRRALRVWADAGLVQAFGGGTGRNDARRFVRLSAGVRPGIAADGRVIDRNAAMTAEEFASTRRKLGHSLFSLGRALGWVGKQPSISRAMKKFEEGGRQIDAALAAKIRALPPVDRPADAPRDRGRRDDHGEVSIKHDTSPAE